MCAPFWMYIIYLNKKFQKSYKNNKIESPASSGSPFSCKGLSNIKEPLLNHPFRFLSPRMILPCISREKVKLSVLKLSEGA